MCPMTKSNCLTSKIFNNFYDKQRQVCNNAFANAIAMKCQLECESKSESGNNYRLLSPAKQAANVKMQVSCLKVQAAASVKVKVHLV